MSNASFLPEDYLARKSERRTNIISLSLFGVVMVSVVGAFFVTNRSARVAMEQQASINAQYQQAAVQIEELTQLEEQKSEMLNKAELAAALVERVPRSILLADLINRMPDRLSLLDFELKSEKVKPPVKGAPPKSDSSGRLKTGTPERAKTKAEASDEPTKIEPPRYKVLISMTGVAPTDLEVSKYMAELNAYSLLRDVSLEYSEQKDIEGRSLRQFKINMTLDPAGDVRRIDPLTVPRLRNPMNDNLQFTSPAPAGAAVTPTTGANSTQEGR